MGGKEEPPEMWRRERLWHWKGDRIHENKLEMLAEKAVEKITP